jgi:PIN domain nuclease of toxin-antitoxin system
MQALALDGLPVEHLHAAGVEDLPMHHRDPFDRLLVAQARAVDATLVTADAAMEPYDVSILWAR